MANANIKMSSLVYKSLSSVLLIAAAVSLIACGKSDNKSETRGGTARTNGVQGAVSDKCSNGQSAVGEIYDTSISQQDYQDRVAALVSATVNPELIGRVSNVPRDPTGIDLRVVIKADQAGNAQNDSVFQLVIHDEYSLSKDANGQQVQPYPITVRGQVRGTVNRQSRSFQVIIGDQFGEVKLMGQSYDGNTIIGTVEFYNFTHYSGQGGFQGQGTLGRFSLPVCAVF